MRLTGLRISLVPAVLALALSGCAFGAPSSSLPYMNSNASLAHLNSTGAGKITHIVYIVQENRSFDNLFHGYPGADTSSKGKISTGPEGRS